MKTLILEDDYASRLVLQRILLGYGEVHVAVNGKEALRMFTAAHAEGAPYEVIFLDLMVPEMSGHAVLREIRAYEQQNKIAKEHVVRILMVTALSDRESVVQAIKDGCDAYLVKPLQADQVRQQLVKFGKIT
jgi:two-component system, chemotaxis family, chemotaxis protein CheY